jgi:hypothetical protein
MSPCPRNPCARLVSNRKPTDSSERLRISLPKLFGKSEWVPNRGSESGQEESKESRSVASGAKEVRS